MSEIFRTFALEMNETSPHIEASRQSLPYYLAEEFTMHTNRPLFITGKAGTGKTTFLRKLREQTPNHPCLLLRPSLFTRTDEYKDVLG